MGRTIVTFTTDFGLTDTYVAQMKAVVLRHAPEAQLVDVTHLIPPQDVSTGAIALERAVAMFEAGTIHLAVVDPGVGTERKLLLAGSREQWIICPDNGLLTWTLLRHGGQARTLRWRPPAHSPTFHGRDIMAPVAGMLAVGTPIDQLAGESVVPVLIDLPPPTTGTVGRVIHLDHYGNATTNLLPSAGRGHEIKLAGRSLRVVRTYGDVASGEPLALVGSSGLLEIAVRDGSAARILGIKVHDEVIWT